MYTPFPLLNEKENFRKSRKFSAATGSNPLVVTGMIYTNFVYTVPVAT